MPIMSIPMGMWHGLRAAHFSGRPTHLYFNAHVKQVFRANFVFTFANCHKTCQFVPAVLLMLLVNRSGDLPTSLFVGGLQSIIALVQRSSTILANRHPLITSS